MQSAPLRRLAFSLIELLVVVTVIVILIALLTPALDEAVYQAQLVSCGSCQKMLAHGTLSYAVDHGRLYPRTATQKSTARVLRINDSGFSFDLRPLITPYVDINAAFNDAMGPAVDMVDDVNDHARIWTGTLWFVGWGIVSAGGKGMYRMGDRFTWTTDDGGGPAERSFGVLAGDRIQRWETQQQVETCHPDRGELFAPFSAQNNGPPTADLGQYHYYLIQSGWRGPIEPTTLDVNFAFDDGAVLRYNRVVVGSENPYDDPWLTKIPYEVHANRYPDLAHHVPAR